MMGDDHELADDVVNVFTTPANTADDLAALTDEPLVDALLDAESYRCLAQQAIHALHDLTQQFERLREQHQRLLDEYRHLRARTLRQEAA